MVVELDQSIRRRRAGWVEGGSAGCPRKSRRIQERQGIFGGTPAPSERAAGIGPDDFKFCVAFSGLVDAGGSGHSSMVTDWVMF